MPYTLKRLVLGFVLIFLASSVLLVSDFRSKAKAKRSRQSALETAAKNFRPLPPKKWKIFLIQYTNVLDVEHSQAWIMEGLKESGLLEGRDFEMTIMNAQGDMITLSSMVDHAVSEGADMLMTMSTPTLQAALKRAKEIPVVFTLVASAAAAGAGVSGGNHLPNVTGVETTSAYKELIAILKEAFPSAKRCGTLFVPSEANSLFNKERTTEEAQAAGIEVVSVAANTSAEVADAALSLSSMKIDALCQIAGNLTASAFPSIARAAEKARLPVFAFQSNQAAEGASVVIARDYYDAGREAAHKAAEVLRGKNPAIIPIEPTKATRILVNQKSARKIGFQIPNSIIARADEIIQ